MGNFLLRKTPKKVVLKVAFQPDTVLLGLLRNHVTNFLCHFHCGFVINAVSLRLFFDNNIVTDSRFKI